MKTHHVCLGRSLHTASRLLRCSSQRLWLAAVGLLLFQSAHATLYLTEPFDYPVESLTNALPWTNSTFEATATLLIVTNDLSYFPLTDPLPTNHCCLQWSINVEGVRGIPGGPLGSPTVDSTVYCSFVFTCATVNGTTASVPIVGVTADQTTTINKSSGVSGPVLFKEGVSDGNPGDYRFGINIGANSSHTQILSQSQVYSAGPTGSTNFIVMKYHFIPGAGNDTVAVWVNPTPSSFGLTEPAATTNDFAESAISGTTDSVAGLSYFHVRGGSGTTAGTCQLDNVRIGTTWADVTPTCISAGVSNPSDESTSPGQTATFSVTGSGTDPTYQWQTNYGGGWENISGATNASYTTPPEVLTDNGLQFQCIVTAPCNGSTATSAAATLTVANCVAAAVSNPTNVTVSPTQTATFSVTPTGTSPTFQWQTNNGGAGFGNLAGATNSSYTTPPEVLSDNGLQFQCVVSVACGGGSSATSAPATLSVVCNPPGVTAPTNQSIIAGQTASFSVTGSGSLPTYQWQNNATGSFVNIPGATNSSYTTPPEPVAANNVQFQCVVSVACDSSSVTSTPAALSVTCNTAQSSQPANVSIGAGQTATFSVTSGSSNPTYQWQTNNGATWVAIPGATNASYTTPPEPQSANGLQFQCVVSEACDSSSVPSGPATLSVLPGNAIFQTTGNGFNISDPNSWEQSFDGGLTWTNPALYPPTDVNSTNIIVQNHIDNDINNQLDQVVVTAAGEITINAGTTLTIASGQGPTGISLDILGILDVKGALAVNSNATVAVETNGLMQTDQGGTYTITGTLTFNNGALYYHNYTTSAGTIPTATWNTGSTCDVIGFNTSAATVAGATQNFYNFTWDCPNQTAVVPFGGNVPTAVNGNFIVTSTGTSEIRLAQNNSPVLDIFGDLDLQGGELTLAGGTGKPKLYLAGNINFTGGTLNQGTNGSTNVNPVSITFVKAGTQTFSNPGDDPITGPITWVVTNGSTLQCIGTLASNLTLLTGGSIYLYMSGPEFVVTGSLTNNYNAVVVDLGGNNSLGSGTYPILNYQGSLSGSLYPIATIVNGSVQAGHYPSIDTASTPNQVNLVVSTNPPPALSVPTILCSLTNATSITLGGTNGAPGATYAVLTTTNVSLPIAEWTSVYTGAFDTNGSFTKTLALTNILGTNLPGEYFVIKALSPP